MLGSVEAGLRSDVEAICSFEDRLPGSDAERRASNDLARQFSGPGRHAELEPVYVQPQWAVVHALHCAIAAIGSMLAVFQPAIGFALVLLAATSAYLDLTARHYLLRRLLFRRASQNVHSRSTAPGRAARVILCANVDAPRTGAAYNPLPVRLLNAAARRLPVATSPTRIWFWSIALLLPPLGARMAELEAGWLSAAQLPQTLILIVAVFLLGEIALSPASPGANANASGVAAVLEAARRLDRDPPEGLSVDVLICGGGETTMEGMRAFVRSHRRDLEPGTTYFVSLESVGRGDPRYVLSQGLAVSLPLDPELAGLCEAIEIADAGERLRPEAIRDGRISAAFVARTYGYPAIAITSREGTEALPVGHHTPDDTPSSVAPDAIERVVSFTVELVQLLDRDLSRRASGQAPASSPMPVAEAPG